MRCNGCEEGVLAQLKTRHAAIRIAKDFDRWEEVRGKGRALLPVARQAAAEYPGVATREIVCQLLLDLPDASQAECDEAIGLARWLARESPRDRVRSGLRLIRSLIYAGRQAEADVALDELRRSIPATETAILKSLEAERAPWRTKRRRQKGTRGGKGLEWLGAEQRVIGRNEELEVGIVDDSALIEIRRAA